MAFANTPVEYYKWVTKRPGHTLYAGESMADARKAVFAITGNPTSKVKEIQVFHAGRLTFTFNRLETGKWEAIEHKPFS
jgi:hypothetical protein